MCKHFFEIILSDSHSTHKDQSNRFLFDHTIFHNLKKKLLKNVIFIHNQIVLIQKVPHNQSITKIPCK